MITFVCPKDHSVFNIENRLEMDKEGIRCLVGKLSR